MAWLIVLILLVLIALAARVDAAPASDSLDLARRFADAITGGAAADRAPALEADDDDDDDDTADDADDDDAADAADDSDDERVGLAPDAEATDDRDELAGIASERDDDDDDDRDALAGLAIDGGGDDASDASPDGALVDASSGALAMLDAEQDPGDALAGLEMSQVVAPAGAQEVYEQWMRHQRPSWLGRLDVGVSWHRRWSAPQHAPARRYDELWLVATWRR